MSTTTPTTAPIGIGAIRKAIPEYCFKASNLISGAYIIRDLIFATILFSLALCIPSVESVYLRVALWVAYSVFQGFVFTGIWILAHECGHGALFTKSWLNQPIGFFLHSLLLVPFFSWQYTHHRHHRYTNHMEKDTAFVPAQESTWQIWFEKYLDLTEDAPLLSFIGLVAHQLFGWPIYLMTYASGGCQKSSENENETRTMASHFNPLGGLFSPAQQPYILLSDAGILATLFGLSQLTSTFGTQTIVLAYLLPYLWVNNWIVAITYLHHTHEDVHHFDKNRWTFVDGSLSTVDRDFGFVGKHLFHGIVEFHVIHHLFPRIPFYYAEEATKAIQPVVGKRYNRDTTPFIQALWSTFRSCKLVVPKPDGTFAWKQARLQKQE